MMIYWRILTGRDLTVWPNESTPWAMAVASKTEFCGIVGLALGRDAFKGEIHRFGVRIG